MANFDVVVIGAGAAGLAAAEALARNGRSVCIVEARERIGGRIFTCHEPGLPVPIELGAELVHGRSPTTSHWLQQANSVLIDVSQQRWRMQSGRLQTGDALLEEMQLALGRVQPPKKDMPFADFLDRSRKKLSPAIRQFARTLVEGFDAADATRVSTLQILEEWSGSASAGAPTFRPLGGYGALVDAIAKRLNPKLVHLSLGAVVHNVEWQRYEVSLTAIKNGAAFNVTAKQAVITLPLGVLHSTQPSAAVRFTPALTSKKEPLARLAVGPVIKVVLHFRRAFWEEADDGRYKDAAFFHLPGAAFPTFWTALPMRAPLLVIWAGGPNAARLSSRNENELVQAALDSVHALFPKQRSIDGNLRSAHVHNWQTDPFARGAYSYVTAGGLTARGQLPKSINGTLFFAGEATDTSGEAATVAGALASGERAARQVLAGQSRK